MSYIVTIRKRQGLGRPCHIEPISVVQMAGAETAQLFGSAVSGVHIPFAKIDIFDAAGGVSVHMRLDDVIVIGFSLLPGAGADRPFNRISLNYEKISITSGGVTRCWNRQTNTPAC